MRVIRCPHCDEPLPGGANFCTTCGQTLTPSPTSVTARIGNRPRSLKVPHFFAMQNGSDETVTFGEQAITQTVKPFRRLSVTPDDERLSPSPADLSPDDLWNIDDIEEVRHNANWHKVVEGRVPRTPSRPRMPVVPHPPQPLPATSLLTPQDASRRPFYHYPPILFWVSTLLLIGLLVGGVFGIVVTLGRGVLAQKVATSKAMSIQITPATVALGAIITVRGTNFSSHTHIGLTRDASIPIADTGGNSIITADGSGSFTDTVVVDAQWQAGSHVIRAEDSLRHKSASFTIIVTGRSPSLRPAHFLISTTALDLGSGDQATNSVKTLTLTNTGGGQISWQATSTQTWLLISPKNGTFANGQSTQITVAADRSNLQPGAYTGQVLFTSNAGQVTLAVKMQTTLLEPDHLPVLQLTPAVLAFTATDGGNNPASQVVTVSNPGSLPFQWNTSISSGNGNWLSVSPESGSVPKAGSQSVVVAVDISSLLPGNYDAVLTFTGQGAGTVKDSPQSVYISLTVIPQCALQVSPGGLSFTAVYLQANPPAKVISLNDTQGCTTALAWNVAASTNNGGPWLNISTAKGQTPAYPTVSVNATGLTPGVYTGSLLFSASTGTETLPVTLTMGQASTPIMSTNPAAINFSGVAGSANPAGQTVTITNTGGGVLNWSATINTNFGGNWLSVSLASGSLSGQQSTSLTVTAAMLASLTPNTYTGAITISGTDGSGQAVPGSPQSIPITFTVLPPCTTATNTPALNFAGVAGSVHSIAPHPVTITANGTCSHALSWTASSSAPWINVTASSGTLGLNSPATTGIGVQLNGLSPQTYTGSVSITSVDSVTGQAVGSPQNVVVTLVVQPPCTLLAPSVASESFSSEAGSNPPPQHFTIGITGTCTGKITITPTATKSWLIVTPASAVLTGGSATFKVKAALAKQPAGSDSDTISIMAVGSNGLALTGGPQTIHVTETVLAPPSLAVSPSTLTFNVTTGTTAQPFNVTNAGGEPLNWTAALNANAPAIVSLAATSGTGLAGGASTSVNVNVNATGVAGGSTFTTSITVSASDPLTGKVAAGSPATITVIINVTAPTMQLSSNTLSYTTTVGVNPTPQSITLTNTGGDGLKWTITPPSQTWLTLNVTSGRNKSQSSSTLIFNVDVTGMTQGTTSTATVVITPSSGNAVTVTVTVTVN